MVDAVWALAALVVSFGLATAGRDLLHAPALQRSNYAGRTVPTAGGIFAVLGFFAVVAAANAGDVQRYAAGVRYAWLVGAFALLGLFDDVVGTASARGLRGHLAAARRGQLSSGVVKLVFGLVVAWLVAPGDAGARVACTLIVAGSANVANLLDVAPGRALKGAMLTFGLVVAFGPAFILEGGTFWFLFAVVGVAPLELREKLMLGDTGANPLGAAMGLLVVGALADSTRALWAGAAVVVAINVAAEFVSFSRVIRRVPPLRRLDELGRRR